MEILEMKEDEIELSLGLSIGNGGGARNFRKKLEEKSSSTTTMSSSSITFDSNIFNNELNIKKKRDGICRDRNGFDLIDNDDEGSEQICKKLKVEEEGNHGCGSIPFPVLPMQFRFHQMPYVPFGSGFNFPYQMMPCWIPPSTCTTPLASSTVDDDDKNVVQPIACKPVRPSQFSNSGLNHNLVVENCDSEQKCNEAKDSDSSGSGGTSSSAVSGSQHGNEIRSRLNTVMSNVHIQSEHSISSKPLKSSLVLKGANTNSGNVILPKTAQSSLSKAGEEQTNPLAILTKPISNPEFSPHSPSLQQLKGPNADNYKPPKPQPTHQSKGVNEDSNKPSLHLSPCQLKLPDEETNQLKKPSEETNLSLNSQPQTQTPQIQSLPKMPCVSTIGDGPNGKTLTGFLYRYTKTEVSIICVCHGTSFSPAEFVKHAGGIDVSHPLKHIVVLPSSFS